jgi:hypothetical protein
MSETKKNKRFINIGGVFFLLIVIPLSLMAFLIANGMFKLGVAIKENTVNVLDNKSQEDIRARAVNAANEVSNFLMEINKDLQVATIIPSTEAVYKQFVSENKKPVWVKRDGKIQQVLIPLYKEMALVDKNGNEQIKIRTIGNRITSKSSSIRVLYSGSNTCLSVAASEGFRERGKTEHDTV